MPSASSKTEKPASTEAGDPLKQAIVIVGHKIRNLEKRKSKLDSYKESIKTLTKEQVEAIAKYDEVVQQLELSKEYVKQFTLISVENDKVKKKQAKKDAQDKYAADVNRIKQILIIQDVLKNMVGDTVRGDFLAGQNGAIQLTENDLKALDDLSLEITPKPVEVAEDGTASENDPFQKAAEHFLAIADGKAKEIAGSTGAKLKELVNSINSCGYFNQHQVQEEQQSAQTKKQENDKPEEEEFHEQKEIVSSVIVPTQNTNEGKMPPVSNVAPVQPMVPGPPIIPGATQPSMMQTNQQPILVSNVANIVPTPVSQVESSFFNAQGFKPPVPPSAVPPPNQNTRQINDVIQSVAGKFNFLQESELEVAEMNSGVVSGAPPVGAQQIPGPAPSTIPTQTFTNQNFNGQAGGAPAPAAAYPPNYPPQPAAFQTFVPAFPNFVPPNASAVQNVNTTSNSVNPATAPPVNSTTNPNIPNSSSNMSNDNKCNNNIPNLIPMAPNRNPNVSYNQSQQQITPNLQGQGNAQNLSQPASQPVFQHSNMSVGTMENAKVEEAVRNDNEVKEKQDVEKRDWSQPESTNWADDWTETTEWNPPSQNQPDVTSSSNKYSSGRPNRNGSGVLRSSNGYQGNRNRTNRQGGYRDSQNNQGGASNYYQNQNGYQSRHERNNDYSVGGKMNSDFRDNTFKERGDFGNRDRDNYGFKRGPSNRGPGMKGSMDRGDRQAPLSRNSMGGPRGPRNLNRQPGGRSGPTFSRQPPIPDGQTMNK